LPLAGLTAQQALVNYAGVRAGEEVPIHGGAGGVGASTIRLAAILGARVTATVRSDEGELVRGFGAQRVIDVRAEGFDESGAAYDIVIDTVGGQTLDRSLSVLRRGWQDDEQLATTRPRKPRQARDVSGRVRALEGARPR
jgi:NADPH:quinone reductase-like Zn-dependent oxidoreductase